MARCSNIILGILNGLGLIIGILLIAFAFSLRPHWESECMKLLLRPLLVTGILVLIFSLAGFIGACCKSNFYLGIYMVLLAIWIVGLVFTAACMFYIASSGPKAQEQAQKAWMQSFHLAGKRWPAVKNCLVEGKMCQVLSSEANNLKESQNEKATSRLLHTGCCKPPQDCGFEFQNVTSWTVPKTGLLKKDGDCTVWNNKPEALCYDCDQCKTAIIGDLRKDAMYFGLGITFDLVLVVITYSLGSCAKRNNQQ